jgi:hypothetical protein
MKASFPFMMVEIKLRCKGVSVRMDDKSEELRRAGNADDKTVEARLRRLPKSMTDGITKPYAKLYSTLNSRFAAFGHSVFGVPVCRVDKDGNKIPVWPEVQRMIDEAQQEVLAGINYMCDKLSDGTMVDMVKAAHGDYFDSDIIPESCDQIRSWYGLDVHVDYKPSSKMTEALLSLSEEERERINKLVDAARKAKAQAEVDAAKAPVIKGIKEFLQDVVKRCEKVDGRTQWKTLADKFDRVVQVLPVFNVDNDETIVSIVKEIEEKFSSIRVDAEKLKDAGSEIRKEMVDKANDIAKRFSDVFAD